MLLLLCNVGTSATQVKIGSLWYTFSGCNATVADALSNIEDCDIPSTVTYKDTVYTVTAIGEKAFYQCSELYSVTIPNSVKAIGKYAFAYCGNLSTISLPDGITTIEPSVFYGCGITTISIPSSVKSIGASAFYGCTSLTSIVIPGNVKVIGENAFFDCKILNSLTISDGVKTIEKFAFAGCEKLSSVSIPGSVTSIGIYAFSSCERLSTLSISYGVTSIEEAAFNSCKRLTSLTIPNSVTSIGEMAFYGCSGLTSITIPGSVTSIGKEAFRGTALKSVYCLGDTPPVCGTYAFLFSNTSTCTLFVSEEGEPYYRTAAIWKDFPNIVVMGNSDTTMYCATPTISFDAETRTLVVESATEGAQCYYTITSDDFVNDQAIGENGALLTGVYTITAYATADGMYSSERTTAKLLWVNAADEDTGVLTAETQRGVIVTTADGAIYVSGTVGGEPIEVYNVNGTKVKGVQATAGKTVITGLPTATTYVLKIGGNSVKVAL